MKNTIVQQSIQKTRNKFAAIYRLVAVTKKQIKKERAQAETQLELLLDEIVQETGLKPTRKNLPPIMLYVSQFVADQQKRKAANDPEYKELCGPLAEFEDL
jgi:hypothetical protein